MKNELNLLMAGGMLFSACGALQSKKTLHTQELQSKSHYQENTNQQSWENGNTLLLDTGNSEYVVQITPLGKFLYSTEKGFEGMAEKVVVRGKADRKQILHQQVQTGHQLQHQKHNLESTQLKTKAQHIDKSKKPRWVVLCIGLVITVGLAYWVMRKWRFD
ncbi:hypothetical protein FFJ24_003625 [Pedobacter sp. KBS0701]|uniref:hypothetical protein n=1 Tax=Pedobacter sp. KBS0701 TaxID=2578106 RepID=UPI00110F5BCA|nr:hypothetical protein [Pedobacter sp. KBS0701]QDW23965.1 hypothetical protein FFJ24_003625 [Pedobacter sp. KBS0701]